MAERLGRAMAEIRHPIGLWFTLRSRTDLASMVKAVHDAFGRWRRRKSIRERCTGGVWVAGLTHRPSYGWHYHLHVVFEGRFLPKSILHREWGDVTDGEGSARVEAVKSARGMAADMAKGTRGDIAGLMFEGRTDTAMRDELWTVMRNKRWFGAWGSMRALIRRPEREKVCCPSCGCPVDWKSWECETVLTADLARELPIDGLWACHYLGWHHPEPIWRRVQYAVWKEGGRLRVIIARGRCPPRASPVAESCALPA